MIPFWISVAGAAPLTVHAAVLADPDDGEVGAADAEAVARELMASGPYVVMDRDVLVGRLGEDVRALYRRCFADASCWRRAGREAGVEQIVLVERLERLMVGVRVVDVVSDGPMRQTTSSGDLKRVLDELFLRPGALVVDEIPAFATVTIDGAGLTSVAEQVRIEPFASGKHTVEVVGEGHHPLFVTVMVYPEQETRLSGALAPVAPPPPKRPPSWPWAAGGLVVAGVAAVAVGLAAGGRAVD